MPREENRAVTRTISGRASWSTWSSASPADEVEAAAPAGHGTPFARTFVRTLNYGSATIEGGAGRQWTNAYDRVGGPANRENVCDRSHPRHGHLRPVQTFSTRMRSRQSPPVRAPRGWGRRRSPVPASCGSVRAWNG